MPSLISALSWADLAHVSIEADSEASGLGVRALLMPEVANVWRSGAWFATTINLRVDLGAARPLRLIGLVGLRDALLPSSGGFGDNGGPGGGYVTPGYILAGYLVGDEDAIPYSGPTIRITASLLSPDGAEVLDTGTLPFGMMPYAIWTLVTAAVLTARYVRLQFTGTDADPYLQLGRLWIGDGLYVSRFLAESDYEPALADTPTEQVRRQVRFTLPAMTQAQADTLENMALAVGTQRQVLAIPRAERAGRSAVLGKFTALPAPRPRMAWSGAGQLHTATLAIQEDR